MCDFRSNARKYSHGQSNLINVIFHVISLSGFITYIIYFNLIIPMCQVELPNFDAFVYN